MNREKYWASWDDRAERGARRRDDVDVAEQLA
ncbi:hypothetical protein ABIA30_002903 [Mycobacterium sp. MAA66]